MRWVLLLIVLLVVPVTADEPDGLFLSPTTFKEPIYIEDAVDLMAPCGSFEYSGCWDMQPVDQARWEPDRASDGEWVLIHGRTGISPRPDEVAYYCWAAGELSGYMNFILYNDKACTTNDVTRLNNSRMSLIRYEDGAWIRFTDYFGHLHYEDCGPFFHWETESYWFVGLEAYTNYDICLSIESLFPSIWGTENWRDNMRLMASEVTNRVYLPNVMRGGW